MATSKPIPTACPLCGFDFTGLAAPDTQIHLLTHMAMRTQTTDSAIIAPRDPSTDW